MTSSLPSSKKDELNGGHVAATANTEEKPVKNFRFFSFRKKKLPAQLDKRKSEKPLRRLSFKSVALTIQKYLIRVALPKAGSDTTPSEAVASGLRAENESSLSSTTDNVGLFNVSAPTPNWNSVFSGIRNHGNTCFLNAIIQCLSHTDLFAKYFVLGSYKDDLKLHRSQARRSSGHGEVTERLAVLIKSLWTSRYSAEISSGFKSVVGKHGEQYKGSLQHDAQEFLLWLLDAVHEDVNRSSKSKNKANKMHVLHPDKSVGYSAIHNYFGNNQSFILDVFQALLRSSLTCPRCGKQSITYDPYLSLSLPIPQRPSFPVRLTYIRPLPHKRHARLSVSIGARGHVSDLLDAVARLVNVSKEALVLTEIYSDGFRKTFHGNQMVTVIQNAHNLFVFELTGHVIHCEKPTLLMQSIYPTLAATVALLVVNCEIQENGRVKRFDAPFSVRVAKELNYADIQEAILKAMPNTRCVKPEGEVFRLRVCNDARPGCCLTPEVDHPLYQSVVEDSLKSCDIKSGPPHVKVIAEWSKDARERYVQSVDANEKTYDVHPSVEQVESLYDQPWIVTLDECLRLYTQEEQLSPGDAWYCPNCKELQQGAKKQLHLHTVPEILIIHLKRFKQLKTGRSKLHLMVDFPVEGLDMSPRMDREQRFHNELHGMAESASGEPIYDLYAVCNHLGNMSAGHYIAVCKNPVDGQWHSYDDFRVDRIPEKDIVTKSAYLLFYVRRSGSARAASPLISNSPVSPDHWLFNVANVSLRSSHSSLQESVSDDQTDGKGNVTECPSLAEHYVARKFQTDFKSNVEQSSYQHVISESCV